MAVTLDPTAGSDLFSGTAGDDNLSAGAGNDTIASGLGADTVAGGAGQADVLVVDYSLSTTAVTLAAPSLTGPIVVGFPSPGGVDFSATGAGIGSTGGRTNSYTGFDTTQFDSLWWGPANIGAAMDGAIDNAGETMTFSSAAGGVLTYTGTTTVATTSGTVQVYTKYVATIVGGAGDWVSAASVGISGGPGYVALVGGDTFQVKQEILASTTLDGTYVPINVLYDSLQTTGSLVRTNVAGQFAYDDGGLSGTIADGEGNSTSFSGIEKFDLSTGSGNDVVSTGGGDDTVSAGDGDDSVSGGGGNDSLVGGAGADTLLGGAGDDTYGVDDAGDSVVEADAEGTDTVFASVSYTLGAAVENLALAGSAGLAGTGNALDNVITGNDGGNVLEGLGGNDSLSGMGGDDTLLGDGGDDTLDGGEGIDRLSAGLGNDSVMGGADDGDLLVVDYSLSTTAVTMAAPTVDVDGLAGSIADAEGNVTSFSGIERLDIRTGEGNDEIHAAGIGGVVRAGAGDDTVSGASGDDSLDGAAGADVLGGGGGNDVLVGGGGADTMDGGAGDDSYEVDDAGDSIVELAGEGNDAVRASVTFTLLSFVENLTLTGAANLNGTGNTLDNQITGNGGANRLAGSDGSDTLGGLAGADTLLGGNGNDTLRGGEANDVLTGGTGSDSMSGGLGNDSYSVDDVGDIARELADQGTDKVTTSLDAYTLGANLETLVGSSALGQALTGNKAANAMTGAAGADTLTGLLGADTLNGGAGNDSLLGGDGDDVLAGGRGRDALTGGAGADLFVFLAGDATLAAVDGVQDFRRAQGDKIDFSGWDANAGRAGVQSFKWAGTEAFHGRVGELRMAAIDGGWQLQGDLDGDGGADFRINIQTTATLELADLIGVVPGAAS